MRKLIVFQQRRIMQDMNQPQNMFVKRARFTFSMIFRHVLSNQQAMHYVSVLRPRQFKNTKKYIKKISIIRRMTIKIQNQIYFIFYEIPWFLVRNSAVCLEGRSSGWLTNATFWSSYAQCNNVYATKVQIVRKFEVTSKNESLNWLKTNISGKGLCRLATWCQGKMTENENR